MTDYRVPVELHRSAQFLDAPQERIFRFAASDRQFLARRVADWITRCADVGIQIAGQRYFPGLAHLDRAEAA